MSHYIHLGRYGRKPGSAAVATVDVVGDGQVVYNGNRYDLRTGSKVGRHPGFAHHLDGRYLQWQNKTEVYLEIVHPGGRAVRVDIRQNGAIRLVGKYLVYNDDARQPWLVIDADTGARLGRVEGMLGESHGTTLYIAAWSDPRDDRTLWLGEESRLAQLDVASRRMIRTIDAAPGHAFIGACHGGTSGTVLALERPLAQKAKFDRSADRIVLFDADNQRLREVAGTVMSSAALGGRFVVSDDGAKRFVVYDADLQPIDELAMFVPGRDGYNVVIPLPSGREWIAVGGRGEWDHYGEPGLRPAFEAAPASAPAKPAGKDAAAKKPVAKDAAANKPAVKKPAAKPAAKKPAAK